jgi:2-polyprenyl-6-methoxyphenol hydroxylase-like FAD-dependent oxidoreductase
LDGSGVRALVVGAGIAGLATARALRRWGATVEVVERAPRPQPAGAGIYLPGNAVRALHALGLGKEVIGKALTIERQRVTDHRGRLLFEVNVADLWRGVGPCLAMPRAQLHQVMLSGVDGSSIGWGRSPESITIDEVGAQVTFDDRTEQRYGLVVGADGVHSTVRNLAFGASGAGSLRPVGLQSWRFLVPWSDPEPVWAARLGAKSTVLTIPVSSQYMYCYCDAPRTDPPRSLRDLLADYAELGHTIRELVEAAGERFPVHVAPIEEVVTTSWHRGPVLLVGDAAHGTSPSMAEGAAMAVEDAIVLADSLASAGNLGDALRAYEQRRRPRTDWVLAQTRRRDRTRTLPPVLRNQVLRSAGRRIFHSNYRPLREPP